MEDKRFKEAVEGAQAQFWAQVAAAYPEAKYGDMGPEDVDAFGEACEAAVRAFLLWNTPQPRFAVGDKVRHVDTMPGIPPAEVREVRPRTGGGFYYTLYDPSMRESFDAAETDDLVHA